MASSAGWSLTESDPGVFTRLLTDLGVNGLRVEELWGLDEELLAQLAPVHALIFLFKWRKDQEPDKTGLGSYQTPSGEHYFAHQVINNACASIAILNAVLNIRSDGVEWGDELTNLESFSAGLDPESRGYIITNSDKIRSVHNSFARSDPFHLDESRPATDDDDAYHFISYVPIGDTLYELDGLKDSPVSHGVIPGGKANWTQLAKSVLESKIASYPEGEVMFNLMAITSRTAALAAQLADLEAKQGASAAPDLWTSAQIDEIKAKQRQLLEQDKVWATEHSLRSHNYVGLVHAVLLELAKQGKLRAQIEGAREEMRLKVAERARTGKPVYEEED